MEKEKKRPRLAKNGKLLALAAAAVFLLFLLISMPAKMFVYGSQRIFPAVYAQNPDGSFWDGSVQLAAIRVKKEWFSLGKIQWKFHPLSLLTGRLSLSLAGERRDLNFQTRLNFKLNGAAEVVDGRFFVRNRALNGFFLPLFSGDGEVNGAVRKLSFKGGILEVDADALWRNAAVRFSKRHLQLGDIEMTVQRRGNGGARLAIKNASEEPLEITARVDYDGDRMCLDARAKPVKKAKDIRLASQLESSLRDLAGGTDSRGFYHYRWKKSLAGNGDADVNCDFHDTMGKQPPEAGASTETT